MLWSMELKNAALELEMFFFNAAYWNVFHRPYHVFAEFDMVSIFPKSMDTPDIFVVWKYTIIIKTKIDSTSKKDPYNLPYYGCYIF